jgi:hypothetical protein
MAVAGLRHRPAAVPRHAVLLLRGVLTAAARQLLAALVVLAACSGDDDDAGTSTTRTTVVRSTGEEAPLEVGDCGDVPRVRVGGPLDPASVDIVPCTRPHDVEVAAVFDHPLGGDSEFPGEAAVDGFATDECLQRFEEYVGIAYEDSTLDVAYVAPGEDGWDDGDRRIACVLYHVDFEPLTGSVRGTRA